MGKTVAEKIFDAHHVDNPSGDIHVIKLDAVFCHEITTPSAINDLVERGKDRVFDPDKIKAVIDHVTPDGAIGRIAANLRTVVVKDL